MGLRLGVPNELTSIARWGRERWGFMLLSWLQKHKSPLLRALSGWRRGGACQPARRCWVMLVMPFGSPSVTVVELAPGSACRKPLLSWPVALM